MERERERERKRKKEKGKGKVAHASRSKGQTGGVAEDPLFFKPLKFVLGLPKWKFLLGKRHFTGKNATEGPHSISC